ncbi:MAG: universal stress protein [Alphaproteobacteria bacterium]
MTRLIALIDGSVYAPSVCDHAAWAAGRTAATVELLHVLGRRDVPGAPADFSGSLSADARDTLLTELAELDAQRSRLAQRRGRMMLDDAKARLHAAGADDVATRLRHGDLLEAVQEFEPTADLVVIGKRGEAADFAKLHLGSNLERVVRACRKPVLVASRAFKPIERFLIAFDGGPSVMRAIEHIARGTLFRGLECRVLAVGAENAEMRRNLDRAGDLLRGAGYTVTTDLRPGQPDAVIAETVEVERIGLLVMGAYGHSRIRSFIIGSTTTEMIRSCLIPVLLFR